MLDSVPVARRCARRTAPTATPRREPVPPSRRAAPSPPRAAAAGRPAVAASATGPGGAPWIYKDMVTPRVKCPLSGLWGQHKYILIIRGAILANLITTGTTIKDFGQNSLKTLFS